MRSKGFTLIELMIVVLIVAILAAVAVPLMRGRVDAAKWSEAKAAMGTISTAIRAYHAEKGPNGAVPTAIFGQGTTELGEYALSGPAMDQLTFTITCTPSKADAPSNYATVSLNQAGTWTETAAE